MPWWPGHCHGSLYGAVVAHAEHVVPQWLVQCCTVPWWPMQCHGDPCSAMQCCGGLSCTVVSMQCHMVPQWPVQCRGGPCSAIWCHSGPCSAVVAHAVPCGATGACTVLGVLVWPEQCPGSAVLGTVGSAVLSTVAAAVPQLPAPSSGSRGHGRSLTVRLSPGSSQWPRAGGAGALSPSYEGSLHTLVSGTKNSSFSFTLSSLRAW